MKYFSILASVVFFFVGCGDDSDPASTGVHFQGRDCLSCHNKDLAQDSHLSVGGTVYSSATADKNNLNNACAETIHMELLIGSVVQYSTKVSNPADSAGFNGRGNLFALINDMPIGTGSYQVRLFNDLGQSQLSAGDNHEFNTGFDLNDPSDTSNRYSCNTCHQAAPNNLNSAPGLLFVPGCS